MLTCLVRRNLASNLAMGKKSGLSYSGKKVGEAVCLEPEDKAPRGRRTDKNVG